jgi:hypothetical protein
MELEQRGCIRGSKVDIQLFFFFAGGDIDRDKTVQHPQKGDVASV